MITTNGTYHVVICDRYSVTVN